MNVYDSHRMTDILLKLGYSKIPSVENADIIILNTCHIREKASEKLYSELGRLKKLKKLKFDNESKSITLAVAGCVAQSDGKELINRAPWVDIVFGPQTYHRLPEFLKNKNMNSKLKIVDTEFPLDNKFDYLPEEFEIRGISSFLTIQEGCDKFCSFCVVPYTRGVEFFRSTEEILKEAIKIIESGAKEIVLLGQNVNAWKGKNFKGKIIGLGGLINELSKLTGLKRIRYTTSHPIDMDDELIETHSDNSILMPYLHLPIQSGSNRILKAMNRKHTVNDYIKIVEKLRNLCPDIAISSDFIVGYPGETDNDFNETMSLIKNIDYSSSYSFKYSLRPGTPASMIDSQVKEEIKSERLFYLQNLLNKQHENYNKSFVGKQLDILVDKNANAKGQMAGKSPYLQSVYFEGKKNLFGKLISLDIIRSSQNSLSGKFTNTRSTI